MIIDNNDYQQLLSILLLRSIIVIIIDNPSNPQQPLQQPWPRCVDSWDVPRLLDRFRLRSLTCWWSEWTGQADRPGFENGGGHWGSENWGYFGHGKFIDIYSKPFFRVSAYHEYFSPKSSRIVHGVYLAGKKHPAVFHHCPTIVAFLLVKSSFSQNHPFVSQNHPVISQNHPRLCILQNSPVRILIEELTVGPRLPGSQLSTRSPASIDVKVTLLRPGDVMAR